MEVAAPILFIMLFRFFRGRRGRTCASLHLGDCQNRDTELPVFRRLSEGWQLVPSAGVESVAGTYGRTRERHEAKSLTPKRQALS